MHGLSRGREIYRAFLMESLSQRLFSMRWLRHYGRYSAIVGFLLIGLILKSESISEAQSPDPLSGINISSEQATVNARSAQRQEQTQQIMPENYDLGRFPVINQQEKHWRNILWTTAIVEPTEPFVADALDQILGMMALPKLTDSQMRTVDAAARVATQLYLRKRSFYSRVEQRFLQAIDQSRDPEWVALSLSTLSRGGLPPEQVSSLVNRVKQRFPNWTKNISLYTTVRDVTESLSPAPVPPLGDLLNWEIAPRQTHLYVICQPDRDVLCQTVLKNRDGEFIRRSDNSLWSIPLLLRSLHGLAWNFVRGQTPQGIYRMEGTVPQPDEKFFRAYGKFPLVNLYVPFEPGAKEFLPGKAGPFKGNLASYQALLPPSWRDNWAIQQSYWAGKAGRSAFRIHGTGESTDFFGNKGNNPNTFNWNPTIGCLSALELYNERGELIDADMPKLLDALEMSGGKKFAGYLVVVEVPGKPGESIALEQIDAAIRSRKSATVPGSSARATTPTTNPVALKLGVPAGEISPPLSDDLRTVSFSHLRLSDLGRERENNSSDPVKVAPAAIAHTTHTTNESKQETPVTPAEQPALPPPPLAY
jgi:hypothetical protein